MRTRLRGLRPQRLNVDHFLEIRKCDRRPRRARGRELVSALADIAGTTYAVIE